ncbi:MAG: SGNH/GDSL hydrolase family protein [Amaricoccus sp.]
MSKRDTLLVFGDSLSDLGAAYELSGEVIKVPIPPSSAGYNGWFSNGVIQSGVTADLLGLDAEGYAVGGARAVGSRTVEQYLVDNGYDTPEIMLPNPDATALATDTYLGGQVKRYVADTLLHPPSEGTMAAIWIGANDYNGLPPDATPEQVAQTITAVVTNTVAAAGAIAATGVEHILLYNLPGPDFLPLTLPPAFAQVVALHNAALAQGVAGLASLGIDAEIVDMNRITGEITADPRTFGLNPAYMKQPMLLGVGSQPTWDPVAQNWVVPANPAVAGVAPDRIAFTDFLHPSSATHGVLGAFAAASVSDNQVFLGDGDDVRRTGPRADLVLAGAGNDRIFSQGGGDTVLAGIGNDRVFGGSGRDILAGGAGDDRMHGGAGDDVVAGSDGNDIATGGAGRDLLVDGLGHDLMAGGAGRDAFLYIEAASLGGSNPDDGGRFIGGSGADTLYLAVDGATRALVEAELHGGSSQRLDAIGVTTRSIEHYVFVDLDDPAAGIATGARLHEADLWGIV